MIRPRNVKLLWWAIGGFFWINLGGSMLHFAFELSEYYKPLALIAAVNESVWEHLKMYFWAGMLLVLVEYTYVRDVANNYWFGQAMGLLVTPFFIILSFYFYLGIAFPMYGRGWLAADIGTGVVGVIAGQYVSYRILTGEPLSLSTRRYAAPALYAVMIAAFLSFTYFPPRIFLFENFFGYTYRGDYGILEDYEPYRIFRPADYTTRAPAEETDVSPQDDAAAAMPNAASSSGEWRSLGRDTYLAACAECHDVALEGVPALGDTGAWAARSPLWESVLKEHGQDGYLEMPAKGGQPDLSDEAVAAAVEYMVTWSQPDRLPSE